MSLYAAPDGRFAIVIELRSSKGNIRYVVEADLVDSVENVESVRLVLPRDQVTVPSADSASQLFENTIYENAISRKHKHRQGPNQ